MKDVHEQYKQAKKKIGLNNRQLAEYLGVTEGNVKNVTKKSREDFPSWAKLFISLVEKHL